MKSHEYYAHKYAHIYLSMAMEASKASVAKRKKVGCVILLPDMTLTHGFNGMPSGSPDERCEDEHGSTKPEVIHSELNAILRLEEAGRSVKDGVLFVTLQPCKDCSEVIVSRGIKTVYYLDDHSKGDIEYLLKHNINVIKLGEE